MKNKELKIVNLFLILCFIFFSLLTLRLSSNRDLLSIVMDGNSKKSTQSTQIADSKRCSTSKQLSINSIDPQLTRLQQYQSLCNSFVTNRMMFFTSFPDTEASANKLAEQVATKLVAFSEAGVSPIVVVEPYLPNGPMSYRQYMSGKYDTPVSTFFAELKRRNISEKQMGMWVPFPESNTPSWDNKDTEPRDFAIVVNKYLTSMQVQFPNTKGSVLLNATTYEPSDLEYENGDYLSLIPYLQDINKNLVSSVGIQGFPWVSRANTSRREIFRASEFLQPNYAIEAAQELRTRDIWFNTGSFAKKYANDKNQTVLVALSDRKAILSDVIEEAKAVQTIQQNQYRVMINLFAEDKSNSREATDWSYFQDGNNQNVLIDFLNQASLSNIDIALYDSTPEK